MLSLDLIKKHLNIENEFTDDDVYLMNLCETAELSVKNAIMPDKDEDLYDDEGEYLPTVK